MAIDLPEGTSLSGIEAAFEDGDGRTQKFEIVLLGESEVRSNIITIEYAVLVLTRQFYVELEFVTFHSGL